jgi:site-specific DNA-methyltransferase (adenine-specific)
VDGHLRVALALRGHQPTVPVVYVDLSDQEERKVLAALDAITGLAGTDDTLLRDLLVEINAKDAELKAFFDSLLPTSTKEGGLLEGADADAAPPVPSEPITKLGDRYVLGSHRLVCGDSTNSNVWEQLLQGDRADAVWTDPPYGVSYVGKTKDSLTIENDDLDGDGLLDLLRSVFALALTHTRGGAPWYVAAPAGPLMHAFNSTLLEVDVLRQCLAWVKDQFVLGRSDYHYKHEPIFYGWSPGKAHTWLGGRTMTSVLEFERPRRNADHPTMKPVALIAHCLSNSTEPGSLVVDPFGGSGSTLIAAQTLGRRAALIEIDPKYCDVIVRRWEKATGRTAQRFTT